MINETPQSKIIPKSLPPEWNNDRFILVSVITTHTFFSVGALLPNNLSPNMLSCGYSDIFSQQTEAAR